VTNIPHELALNFVIIGILFIFGMYYLSTALKKRLKKSVKKSYLTSLLLPISIILFIILFFGIGFTFLLQGA